MLRGSHLSLLVGLSAALLGQPAGGQGPELLESMSGTRGLVAHGKGGFLGAYPGSGPFTPIAGDLGRSLALADLDGDGFDDLIVGAPLLPSSPQTQVVDGAGHAYVIFGSESQGAPGSGAKFELDPIAAGTALNLFGDPGDRAGASVAAAGDVNGDGFQDAIIGTPDRSVGGRVGAGGAYILFGSADLATLPTNQWLSSLAAQPGGRALFVQGAREFGAAGTSVSGDADLNADGRADVVIGAPLDSTNGLSENGTATVLYGQPGFPGLHTLDLATLAAGQGTVVHGSVDLEFLGWALAGLGRFDAVLPQTNGQTHATLGDDVAIGAPGAQPAGKVFAGAVYVLRGVAAGSHAASYLASDFGNGPFKAGLAYFGAAGGDQAGASLARVGPPDTGADGFNQLAMSAPFHEGVGKADSGTAYVLFGGLSPQGADLGALPPGAGITIWGATTAGGQRGVSVSDSGDFDGDGVRDLAVAHPNAALVIGTNAHVGAGRVRILDGSLLWDASAPIYLGAAGAPWSLLEFSGEAAGDYAGSALAAGDLNGDSEIDLAVGAPGAASDPKLQDPTGVARLESGRAHVVYGEILRLSALQPAASWFGGPAVTATAVGVPDALTLTVEGQPAQILALVPGAAGSISFAVPPPPLPGLLADVAVASDVGSDVLEDALQYLPLSIESGPLPPVGFPGSSVSFTGEGFSTVADTEVLVGGFPAAITALDGPGGTMTIALPAGPPEELPLDVEIENSNGSVTLAGSLVYQPVIVAGVSPGAGPQTSGVFVEGAKPFAGQPAVPVAVTVLLQGGPPAPGDLVIEFGTESLGYKPGLDPQIAGSTVTVLLPTFLLGPQDVVVDVRARLLSSGEIGVLPQAFTYLESDYTELGQFGSPGLGPGAPASLMAGEFTNGGEVLLLMTGWQGPQSLSEWLFVGFELADPPLAVLGGLLGVEPVPQFVIQLPGGTAQLHISQAMPTDIPASADGVSLYLQVITQESGGGIVYGFSNVLQMTIDLP